MPLRQTAQLGGFYFGRERRSQIKVYITDEQNTTVSNIDVCEFTVGRAFYVFTPHMVETLTKCCLFFKYRFGKKSGAKVYVNGSDYWKWTKVWFDDRANIVEHKNDIKCTKRISGEEAFSCITLKRWII